MCIRLASCIVLFAAGASPSLLHADILSDGGVDPSGLVDGQATTFTQVGGPNGSTEDGSLEINGGSTLSIVAPSPFLNIGQTAGSTGAVAVTGAGSLLSLEGRGVNDDAFLTVGRDGAGALDITNGGAVRIDALDGLSNRPANGAFPGFQVGRSAGSSGVVTVSGEGSALTVGGAFATGFVGRRGEGVLNVADGGLLRFEGINSDLNAASDLGDVTTARGEINVTGGGRIENLRFLDVGGQPGGSGLVNILGPGSEVSLNGRCAPPCPPEFSSTSDVGAFVTIGAQEGAGVVNIRDGGVLRLDPTDDPLHVATGLSLGGSSTLGPRGDGTLNVAGTDSAVLVTGNNPLLTIGRLEDGVGAISISDGGRVVLESVGGTSAQAFVGDRPGARGNVLIDGPASLLDVGAALRIGVDSSTGSPDSGDGAVTLMNGGVIRADLIDIGAGGVLKGNGDILGSSDGVSNSTIVNRGGAIAPGLSPGTLTFDGDLELAGGTLMLEAFAPDQLDRIDVAGDLILGYDGAIEVLLGFTPGQGDVLDFISVGGDVVSNGFSLDQIVIMALGAAGPEAGSIVSVGFGGEVFASAVNGGIAPIPLPAPLLLLLTGLGGLIFAGRRRRA